jgi:acetyl esterase/lipase
MVYQEVSIKVEGSHTEGYEPKLCAYLVDNKNEMDQKRKRPAILVCPGGGYSYTSDREAEPVAIRLLAMGFQAFVLRYSCAPARFPTAQLEAAKAILTIREHAQEWHVDPEHVVIMGFSAGGHLAASIGVFWDKEWIYGPLHASPKQIRPDGMVLCYPVITSGEYAHRGSFDCLLGEDKQDLLEMVSLENQVSENTPPAFLWHTFEDASVPLENTLFFVSALRKAMVSTEVHIYPKGGHGLALANEETDPAANPGSMVVKECQGWIQLAGDWVRRLK